MKSEKGITLITLAIYILIVFIVLAMLATLTTNFRSNLEKDESKSIFLVEYDKFNMYFLNEVKNTNNDIEQIDINGKYIEFTNGNKYSYENNKIYLIKGEDTKIIIANSIGYCKFTEEENDGKTIINVEIKINNETKNVKYTLKKENQYNDYQDEGEYSQIPVTGITLDNSTLNITVSQQSQLQAIIEPEDATNQNLSWESSNINVASVDSNGLVTGNEAGTATITVTTEYGNFSATCTATVTE